MRYSSHSNNNSRNSHNYKTKPRQATTQQVSRRRPNRLLRISFRKVGSFSRLRPQIRPTLPTRSLVTIQAITPPQHLPNSEQQQQLLPTKPRLRSRTFLLSSANRPSTNTSTPSLRKLHPPNVARPARPLPVLLPMELRLLFNQHMLHLFPLLNSLTRLIRPNLHQPQDLR